MVKGNIAGQRYERLEVLMSAWIENNQQVWMCVCDCKQIRFITTAQWKCRSRKSCGCLRREVTRAMAVALNSNRVGKPRSEKGKEASKAACKKMNRCDIQKRATYWTMSIPSTLRDFATNVDWFP